MRNNDFKKFAASFGLSTFNQSLGKIKFDTVFGNQNKGNPGEIGSFSISRTKKNIFMTFMPTSGCVAIVWLNLLTPQIQN